MTAHIGAATGALTPAPTGTLPGATSASDQGRWRP